MVLTLWLTGWLLRPSETKWNIKCAKFLFGLIRKNHVYKDALRELGIFEILISCLHKFAATLKERLHVEFQPSPSSSTSTREAGGVELEQGKKELGFLIMDMIACMLSQNTANTSTIASEGVSVVPAVC